MSELSLTVPQDDEAERVVAAVVIATRFALSHVADVVTATDFYNPALGRLFAVAPLLDDLAPFQAPVSSEHVRVGAASVLAEVPLSVLERLLRAAPVMWDARRWAHRVADAARRRRAMAAVAQAYNLLAAGAGVDDVSPLLSDATAA